MENHLFCSKHTIEQNRTLLILKNKHQTSSSSFLLYCLLLCNKVLLSQYILLFRFIHPVSLVLPKLLLLYNHFLLLDLVFASRVSSRASFLTSRDKTLKSLSSTFPLSPLFFRLFFRINFNLTCFCYFYPVNSSSRLDSFPGLSFLSCESFIPSWHSCYFV